MSNVTNVKPLAPQPSLVTASGDPLPIRGYIRAQSVNWAAPSDAQIHCCGLISGSCDSLS